MEFSNQAKELFLAGVANDLTNELVKAAPFKTGTLANSLQLVKQSDGQYKISAVDYAMYVEFGTAPHIIEAKNGKALHWKTGNEDHFAVRIHHPGTQPNPFIRRTIKNKLPDIIKRNIKLHLITATS